MLPHRMMGGDQGLNPWAMAPPGGGTHTAGLDPSVMARPGMNYMPSSTSMTGQAGLYMNRLSGFQRLGRRDVRTRLGGRDSRASDRNRRDGNRNRKQRSRSPKRSKKLSSPSKSPSPRRSSTSPPRSSPRSSVSPMRSPDSSRKQSVSPKRSSVSPTRDSESPKRKSESKSPRRSSASPRRSRSSSPKRRKRSSPKKKSEEPEEQVEDIAVEALKCHLCGIDKFDGTKAFIKHLKSRSHTEIQAVIKSKGHHLLSMLRSEAKMASYRQIFKKGGKKPVGSGDKCQTCHAEIPTTESAHNKTIEHQILEGLLRTFCCNQQFGGPRNASLMDIEHHRLSLKHLRTVHESKENTEPSDDVSEPCDEFGEPVKDDEVMEEDITLDSLTPYNPNTSYAERFMDKQVIFTCNLCSVKIPASFSAVEEHCATKEHYDKLKAMLKKKKDKKEAEERSKRRRAESRSEKAKNSKTRDEESKKEIDSAGGDDDDEEEEWGAVEEVGEVLDQDAMGQELDKTDTTRMKDVVINHLVEVGEKMDDDF